MAIQELSREEIHGAAQVAAQSTDRLPWALRHWLLPAWRDPLRRRVLALADTLTALVVAASLVLFGPAQGWVWATVVLPLWLVLAKLLGLYDQDHRVLRHLTIDEAPKIMVWALMGTGAIDVLLQLATRRALTPGNLVLTWVVGVAAALVFRSTARHVYRRIAEPELAVVIGSGKLAEAAMRKLSLFPDIHVRVAARFTEFNPEEFAGAFDRVVVAAESLDEEIMERLIGFCRERHLKLSVVPPVRGVFGTAVLLGRVADLAVVEYNTWGVSPSTLFLKRTLDLCLGSLMLIVLCPLFLIIALAVKLDSRGPVFFIQTRAGRDGKSFRMIKFRSMARDAEERLSELVRFEELDQPMFKLRDDPRTTRVGRVLRRTSFDELPQLLNVVAGQMSLVGPRPEQVELVERYPSEHRFRLSVRPGLTGPMQVSGRGALTFDERLAVEREYIENLTVARDLRIIAMTLTPVLTGRGAY